MLMMTIPTLCTLTSLPTQCTLTSLPTHFTLTAPFTSISHPSLLTSLSHPPSFHLTSLLTSLSHPCTHLNFFSTALPPFLTVDRVWNVTGDAKVGTEVTRVQVQDLTGEGYNLTLQDPKALLRLHQGTGQVTVAANLTQQVQTQSIHYRIGVPT